MDALNQTADNLPSIVMFFGENHPLVQAAIILVIQVVTMAGVFFSARFFFLNRTPCPLANRVLAIGAMAAVLFYCYLADRTAVFQKLEKPVSEPTFLFICYLATASGLVTVRRSSPFKSTKENLQDDEGFDLLSRQQTEEWKGWMQIAILLYHYFGMSQTLHVYRLIRVLVGSYLFLTGYGHTIYFLRTNDFSLHRVVSVLARLNLLPSILSFVMGSKYDMYYFPALSTFWFMLTWAVVPRTSGSFPWRTILMRVLFAALALELLLRVPVLWYNCAHLIHMAKGVDIDAKDFLFRLSLDRFVPHVGILTACVNEYLRRQRLQLQFWSSQLRQAAMLFGSLCLLAFYFLILPTFSSKEESNHYHPFTEAIPILAFAILRNSHPTLRKYHSRLFSWVGRHSLETFVLQYHIWLAGDAKKTLSSSWCGRGQGVSIAGSKCWIERCLITALFLLASYLVSRSTSVLTVWLVGPKECKYSNGFMLPPFGTDRAKQEQRRIKMGVGLRFVLVVLLIWFLNIIY